MPTTTQQLYALTAWEDIDGTTTVWNFVAADGYIEQNDIKARYFLADGTQVNVPLIPANFTGPNQLTITPPIPATAARFEIYRDTEKQSMLVDFEDGNRITEAALNLSARQAVYVAVEAVDIATQAEANSKAAVVLAEDALAQAAAAVVTANDAESTANNALTIVQDFVSGGTGGGGALDADTLGGQPPAYYLDLPNATGILPIARLTGTYDINISGLAANATKLATPRLINGVPFDGTADITISGGGGGSDTAAQILTKLLTVDGTGSGLDADLLDGQHGSYYTDIVARLGFTPYNSTNPSGYITAAGAPVQSVFGRTGAVVMGSGDVTTALGFTPYNSTNPSGYQTAAQVTTSLASYLPLAGGTMTGNLNLFRTSGIALATLRGSATFGAGFYGQFPGVASNMFGIADRATAFGGTAGETASIYTAAAVPLTFDVAAAERMRIAADGAVTMAGTLAVASTATVGGTLNVQRQDGASEGGQINLCRSNDNTTAWAIDVVGPTAAPTLRFINVGGGSSVPLQIDGGGLVSYGGIEVGYRGVPTASVATGAFVAADRGKRVKATGAITIPNSVMADGDVVHVLNTTGSAITITKTITTAYNKNTGTALGATFTLAARGGMTIEFTSGTECYVGGNIS